MALDKYGNPTRRLDPDLFTASQNSAEGPLEVWITAELKDAARALLNSWDFSHEEVLASLNIRDVNMKFETTENRAAFFKALKTVAKLVNPNFPSTFPLLEPRPLPEPNAAELPMIITSGGHWLPFWFKYFMPDLFDEVMQDIAGTTQHSVRVHPQILKETKAFLEAYRIFYVRMNLVAEEGADRSTVESLTESLRKAHSILLQFLNLLVKSLPEPEVHRVILLGADQIQMDGELKDFTGAALRALLTLALLRNQAEFGLEVFARHYHGGGVEDTKTDFDNAMKALKKVLPYLAVKTPSKNHRSVSGIKFLLEVDENLISRRLAAIGDRETN